MNRRFLLKWLSTGLAAACAAFVAVPGMSFVLSALRRPDARQGHIVPGRAAARPAGGSSLAGGGDRPSS